MLAARDDSSSLGGLWQLPSQAPHLGFHILQLDRTEYSYLPRNGEQSKLEFSAHSERLEPTMQYLWEALLLQIRNDTLTNQVGSLDYMEHLLVVVPE